MRYRTWLVAPALAALSAGALACGGSSTGPAPAELVGAWTATKVEYVSVAVPTQNVDLVAQGSTVTLEILDNHTYVFTVATPSLPDDVSTGTWSASSDIFTVTVTGMSGEQQFQMSLVGSTLTLSGADVDYDVNDDGTDEPAKLSMVLTK